MHGHAQQRVHGLGVADELESHESTSSSDVVLAHCVRVALDRGEHESVHLADAGEARGDRLGFGDVEGDAGRSVPDRARDPFRPSLLPPRQDHAVAATDDLLGDLEADSGCSADDDDGALAHCSSSSFSVR